MLKLGFSPYENRDRRGPCRFCPERDSCAQRWQQEGHEVVDFGTRFAGILRLSRISPRRWRATWPRAAPTAASWSAPPASAWPSPPTKSRACARRSARSADEVRLTREHNDANVLTLGAKYLDEDRARTPGGRLSRHRIRRRPARAAGGEDRGHGAGRTAAAGSPRRYAIMNAAGTDGAAPGRSRSRSLRGHPAARWSGSTRDSS